MITLPILLLTMLICCAVGFMGAGAVQSLSASSHTPPSHTPPSHTHRYPLGPGPTQVYHHPARGPLRQPLEGDFMPRSQIQPTRTPETTVRVVSSQIQPSRTPKKTSVRVKRTVSQEEEH